MIAEKEEVIRINVVVQGERVVPLHLPDNFWCYAVQHSTNILNILPTRSTAGNLTPHEAFIGDKLSIAHFCIFGCKAYAHIPKEKRDKFVSTSLECTFIGYAENCKAYHLYHKPT